MDLAVLRDDLIDGLVHPSKGVLESQSLAAAMRTVPRHEFLDTEPAAAYEDRQYTYRGTTVLAPSLVARLLERLDVKQGQSVLVVGAGVGYTVAVIAELVGSENVSAVDLARPLVIDARQNLATAGYREVLVDCRNGADGLEEYAPYDRILIEAAAIEPPQALINQLAEDGRLVFPHGLQEQRLAVYENGEIQDRSAAVQFKPLLIEGEQTGGIERDRTVREERERAAQSIDGGWEQDWIDWERR